MDIVIKSMEYFKPKINRAYMNEALKKLTEKEKKIFLEMSDYDKFHSLEVYKKVKKTELKNNEEVNSKETEHILALLKENTLNIENAVEAIKDNEKQNAEHIQSFADKASETTLLFNDLISFIIELSEIFKHLQAE